MMKKNFMRATIWSFRTYIGFLTKLTFILILIALTTLTMSPSASADTTKNVAAVQCDSAHNKVLITFGTVMDENPALGTILTAASDFNFSLAPVPPSLLAAWSKIPYDNGADCVFANGQRVSVSILDGSISDDAGGGSSDSSFTMIVNHHIVYDDLEYYRGHDAGYDLSAIQYDGKSLLECNPQEPDEMESQGSNPVCYDVSKRLLPGHKYLTADEEYVWDQDELKKTLTSNESPFCRSVDKVANADPSPANFWLTGNEVDVGNNGPAQQFFFDNDIDIYNDGKPQRVIEVGVNNNYGGSWSYLMLFKDNHEYADKFIQFLKSDYDFNSGARHLPSFGGTLVNLSGPWPPLSSISNPIEYAGKVYILTSDGASTVLPIVPSGILSQILPNDTAKTICEFP